MKNSEMKTIIRHIDHLTRKLNARGRRRYADAPDQQQKLKLKNAKYGAEVWARNAADAAIRIHTNSTYKPLVENEEFDKLKQIVQKDIEYCEKFVDATKELIKYCDEFIKAQRG